MCNYQKAIMICYRSFYSLKQKACWLLTERLPKQADPKNLQPNDFGNAEVGSISHNQTKHWIGQYVISDCKTVTPQHMSAHHASISRHKQDFDQVSALRYQKPLRYKYMSRFSMGAKWLRDRFWEQHRSVFVVKLVCKKF